VLFPLAHWSIHGLFVTDEIVPDSIENPLYFRTGTGEEQPYGDAAAESAYQAVDAGWLKDQWDLLMEQSVAVLPPNRGNMLQPSWPWCVVLRPLNDLDSARVFPCSQNATPIWICLAHGSGNKHADCW
jgi:hypothetical protein